MKGSKPRDDRAEMTKAIGRALRRAGKRARAVAKAHGTPVYVMKNGKVVAEKP
jgi:hypothetical protein